MMTKCVPLVMLSMIFSARLPGADAPTISRPVLGYIGGQPSPGLWTVYGVPGAAVIGEPFALPRRTTHLDVAPGQQYAIIGQAGELPAVLMIEGTSHGAMIRIPGVMPSPEAVWFSPSGSSAALASHASGRAQISGGVPLAPAVRRDIDFRTLQGFPNRIAVNDSASSVLYGTPDAVHSLLPDGSSRIVLSVAAEASIGFLPASDTVAIGDPDSGAVSLFKGFPGGPTTLASGMMGLGHLAASRDGRFLLVAGHNSPQIWAINLSTGVVNEFHLQVTPERLDSLRSADTFLISSKAGEPDWIVSLRAGRLTAVFIPHATRDNPRESK